jgi:hypothetical protein
VREHDEVQECNLQGKTSLSIFKLRTAVKNAEKSAPTIAKAVNTGKLTDILQAGYVFAYIATDL